MKKSSPSFFFGFLFAVVLFVGFKDYAFVFLKPQKLLANLPQNSSVDLQKATPSDTNRTAEGSLPSLFSVEQQAEIERIVLKLFQEKPAIVSKSLEKGVQNQQREIIRDLEKSISVDFETLKTGGISLTKKVSANHFVVFADPLCHYCQNFEKTMLQVIEKGDDISFSFYPISFLDEKSNILARFLYVASQVDVKKMLTLASSFAQFKKTEDITLEAIQKLVKDAKLTLDINSINSEEVKAAIDSYTKQLEKYQVPGVPAIFAQHHNKKDVSIFTPLAYEAFIEASARLKNSKEEVEALQKVVEEQAMAAGQPAEQQQEAVKQPMPESVAPPPTSPQEKVQASSQEKSSVTQPQNEASTSDPAL